MDWWFLGTGISVIVLVVLYALGVLTPIVSSF